MVNNYTLRGNISVEKKEKSNSDGIFPGNDLFLPLKHFVSRSRLIWSFSQRSCKKGWYNTCRSSLDFPA